MVVIRKWYGYPVKVGLGLTSRECIKVKIQLGTACETLKSLRILN